MSFIKPPHHKIPSNGPNGFSPNPKWVINVLMHISPGAIHIPAQVVFEAVYIFNGGIIKRSFLNYICNIPDDALVNIAIAPGSQLLCRWSQSVLAITAKDDYSSHMGGINFLNGTVSLKVKSKLISPPFVHYLNLNVEILQGTTTTGQQVWLPVTFDPDVINPRPPQRSPEFPTMDFVNPNVQLQNAINSVEVEDQVIVVIPPQLNHPPLFPIV